MTIQSAHKGGIPALSSIHAKQLEAMQLEAMQLEEVQVKRPVTAFVFALASAFLTPIFLFIEFTALFGAAMITYEPSNPLWVKIISVVVVVLIGLFATAVPVLALIMGTKSRAAAKLIPTKGAGLATAAVAIAGIVTAGVVVTQVYVVLTSFEP